LVLLPESGVAPVITQRSNAAVKILHTQKESL
jgi:hypothetical protein